MPLPFLTNPIFKKIAAAVGTLYILSFVFDFVHGIFARLIRPGKDVKKIYGTWAVVTGGTDGIGYAMAEEFARKGMNVMLISRTLSKLTNCKDELASLYPKIEIRTLDIDFSKFDEAARKRVADAVKGLDVGVLVNNVGVSYPFTKYFDELTDNEVAGLIALNIDSTTWMTRIVLPLLVEKKKGAIVNISSIAGVSNSPLLAQYGAAKSYIAMFSRALNVEYKSKGIHVQCQVPMFVATKLAKLRKASLFVASPKAYAKAAVRAIGFETVVSPYWSHALQVYLLTTLPEWITSMIVMNMHQGIRKAGMKKEAAAKKE